jgi:hypothetical protein
VGASSEAERGHETKRGPSEEPALGASEPNQTLQQTAPLPNGQIFAEAELEAGDHVFHESAQVIAGIDCFATDAGYEPWRRGLYAAAARASDEVFAVGGEIRPMVAAENAGRHAFFSFLRCKKGRRDIARVGYKIGVVAVARAPHKSCRVW